MSAISGAITSPKAIFLIISPRSTALKCQASLASAPHRRLPSHFGPAADRNKKKAFPLRYRRSKAVMLLVRVQRLLSRADNRPLPAVDQLPTKQRCRPPRPPHLTAAATIQPLQPCRSTHRETDFLPATDPHC